MAAGLARSAMMLGALALTLAGCESMGMPSPQLPGMSPTQSVTDSALFSQINDIPIPANTRFSVDKSLVMGGPGSWTGRARLEVPYAAAEMYDFFRREMGDFGWKELSAMQAIDSVMVFAHGSRLATFHVVARSANSTAIDITVAPATHARKAK